VQDIAGLKLFSETENNSLRRPAEIPAKAGNQKNNWNIS